MNPRLSYLEESVRGASPVRLVTLLYEQAIEDLRRALAAHACGDIERRTHEIDHAMLVLGHLQATLDKQQGGQVAANLELFYEQIRSGLVQAQCRQSPAELELQISRLRQVRDAWCEVDRSNVQPAIASESAPSPAEREQRPAADWNA